MIHLLAEFYNTHWALNRPTLDAMQFVIERWDSGVRLTAEQIHAAIGDAPQARAERTSAAQAASGGGVAVVPVYGVLTHRGHTVDNSSSALTSTERLASTLRTLVRDSSVSAVCLDFNSPGGSVFGVQELADTIYSLRGEKPIVGVANATAASGGYWAISQCDEVVVTPSGCLGSIGVIMAHENLAAKLEKDGRQVEYIYSGKNKAEGNSTGPLTDESRAHFQALSDAYYADFTKSIARGRKVGLDVVRSAEWGQGRTLLAREAVSAGMADRIDTLENTVARLMKPQGRRSAMSASLGQARIDALRLGQPIDA